MITTVIKLQDDMVMVFSVEGEQMPEYQGQYEDVRGSILRDAPSDAVFTRWFNCDAEPEIILREVW